MIFFKKQTFENLKNSKFLFDRFETGSSVCDRLGENHQQYYVGDDAARVYVCLYRCPTFQWEILHVH